MRRRRQAAPPAAGRPPAVGRDGNCSFLEPQTACPMYKCALRLAWCAERARAMGEAQRASRDVGSMN